MDRTLAQPVLHHCLQVGPGVGDAAAGATQREGRAAKKRKAELVRQCLRFGQRLDLAAPRHLHPRRRHRILEEDAVFGDLDGADGSADELDAVALQHAGFRQLDRQVERCLPTDRRQQRVGTFVGDDLLQHRHGERLNVGGIGQLRVGHDRRRVRIDEHDAQAFTLQRFDGLGAGIVELGGLADDDRAGAEDQDAAQVVTAWHSEPR